MTTTTSPEDLRTLLNLEPHPTCGYVSLSFVARERDGLRFLGASTEWPGVDPSDVIVANPSELAERFPAAATLIKEFTATL